jgi:hypothetical protein
VISKGKIKIANRLLEKLCTIFEGKSYSDLLDLLDENDLPQASDVALIYLNIKVQWNSLKKSITVGRILRVIIFGM